MYGNKSLVSNSELNGAEVSWNMSWKDGAGIKGTLQQVSINFINAFEWSQRVLETCLEALISGTWPVLKCLFTMLYINNKIDFVYTGWLYKNYPDIWAPIYHTAYKNWM